MGKLLGTEAVALDHQVYCMLDTVDLVLVHHSLLKQYHIILNTVTFLIHHGLYGSTSCYISHWP